MGCLDSFIISNCAVSRFFSDEPSEEVQRVDCSERERACGADEIGWCRENDIWPP